MTLSKPDLVTANSGWSTVSVLLGNGDGTFADQTTKPVGNQSVSVAVGDLNGDAKPDLVTANSGSNTVSVLLGNGDGTFANQTTKPVGTRPWSVAIADLNGDAKPDLVTANSVSNTVSVLLGNGDGTFANQTTKPVGITPVSVAIGDLNDDAKPDLVTANPGSDSVSVLLGNGDGTFADQTAEPAGYAPQSVAIADLSGDAKLDLAVADFSGDQVVRVLRGNGNGTFEDATGHAAGAAPGAVTVADLDGDAQPDVATANTYAASLSVLRNTTLTDTTAPKVTITTPPDQATYTLGDGVLADYTCADETGGSGLASCEGTTADGAAIDTATVGAKTLTVTAIDKAGNTTTVAHRYTVAYAFGGFLAPIDSGAVYNILRAGQGVPVKFSLGGNYGLNVLKFASPSTIACDSSTQTDVVETTTAGASGLTYDAASGVYSYVWKTDKAWANSCRMLTVTLTDGVPHTALFKFTR